MMEEVIPTDFSSVWIPEINEYAHPDPLTTSSFFEESEQRPLLASEYNNGQVQDGIDLMLMKYETNLTAELLLKSEQLQVDEALCKTFVPESLNSNTTPLTFPTIQLEEHSATQYPYPIDLPTHTYQLSPAAVPVNQQDEIFYPHFPEVSSSNFLTEPTVDTRDYSAYPLVQASNSQISSSNDHDDLRYNSRSSSDTATSSGFTYEMGMQEQTPIKVPKIFPRRATSSTQCHICGKIYTEPSNLSKHIRTVHLKLRPFECHLCTSKFAEKNKLRKHIQSVHEHVRPYKCELCEAAFSQASDRKRHHLILHEGWRPFVCNLCGKAFGRRSSLSQHLNRIHKQPLLKSTRQSSQAIYPRENSILPSVPNMTPNPGNGSGLAEYNGSLQM